MYNINLIIQPIYKQFDRLYLFIINFYNTSKFL